MRKYSRATTLAALGLSGCAHILGASPAWYCTERASDGKIEAATTRTLDARGRQIAMRSHWVRSFALQPRIFIHTEWVRRPSPAAAVDGRVTFRFTPRRRLQRYRLELRAGTPHAPAPHGRLVGEIEKVEQDPKLISPWSAVGRYAFSGQPLFLVAVDGSGRLLDAEPVDAGIFRGGLTLVERTDRGSAAKVAAYPHRCEKHQKVILV